MATVTCPGCGSEVPANEKNCIVCGYSFPDKKGPLVMESNNGSPMTTFWLGFWIELVLGIAFVKTDTQESWIFLAIGGLIIAGFFNLLIFGVEISIFSPVKSKNIKGITVFVLGCLFGFLVGFFCLPIFFGRFPISVLEYWNRFFKK